MSQQCAGRGLALPDCLVAGFFGPPPPEQTPTGPSDAPQVAAQPDIAPAAPTIAPDTAELSARPEAPEFDVVRVEPDGSAVLAGRAVPGAQVTVRSNGEVLGTSGTNRQGEWVIVPEVPLAAGGVELTLEAQDDAGTLPAAESVIVLIRPDAVAPPIVIAARPGEASQVLQGLVAPQGAPVPEAVEVPTTAQSEAGPPPVVVPEPAAPEPVGIAATRAPTVIGPQAQSTAIAGPGPDGPPVTVPPAPIAAVPATIAAERAGSEQGQSEIGAIAPKAPETPAPLATPLEDLAHRTAVAEPEPGVAEAVPEADTLRLAEAAVTPGSPEPQTAATLVPTLQAPAPPPAPQPQQTPIKEHASPASGVPMEARQATLEPEEIAPLEAPGVAPGVTVPPTIDAIEIEGERNFFAGGGPEGRTVRLYVNNRFVADALVTGGRWLVEAENVLVSPRQRVRADLLRQGSADVAARAEVNFVIEGFEEGLGPQPAAPPTPALPRGVPIVVSEAVAEPGLPAASEAEAARLETPKVVAAAEPAPVDEPMALAEAEPEPALPVAPEIAAVPLGEAIEVAEAEAEPLPAEVPIELAEAEPEPLDQPLVVAEVEPETAPLQEPMAVAKVEPGPAPVEKPMVVAEADPETASLQEPMAVAEAEPELAPVEEPMAVAEAEPELAPVEEPMAVAEAEPDLPPLQEPMAVAEAEPDLPLEEPLAVAEAAPAPIEEPTVVAEAEPEPALAAVPEVPTLPLEAPLAVAEAAPEPALPVEPDAKAAPQEERTVLADVEAEPLPAEVPAPVTEPELSPEVVAEAEPDFAPLDEPTVVAEAEPVLPKASMEIAKAEPIHPLAPEMEPVPIEIPMAVAETEAQPTIPAAPAIAPETADAGAELAPPLAVAAPPLSSPSVIQLAERPPGASVSVEMAPAPPQPGAPVLQELAPSVPAQVVESETDDVPPIADTLPAIDAEIPTLTAVAVGEDEDRRFVAGKVIIRRGDNLWTIAQRVYGRGIRYSIIYQANSDQIRDPHWIYPGQVFDLPETGTGVP